LVAVALLQARASSHEPARMTAPAFTLDDVRGGTVAYHPGRPTVVNFFAAWCAPCRQELPRLRDASASTAGRVDFVGVDVADSRSNAADLLRASAVRYPAGYDPDKAVSRRFAVVGMPTTHFVRADGRVDAVVKGPISEGELRRRLARLERLNLR
jgi:thiol-disulfide isomerase/thioredoxin